MKSDTQATHNLMRRFYENLWQKKMGKLAALRVAQLSIVDGAPSESAGVQHQSIDLSQLDWESSSHDLVLPVPDVSLEDAPSRL